MTSTYTPHQRAGLLDLTVKRQRTQLSRQRWAIRAFKDQEIALRAHLEDLGARYAELERRLAAAELRGAESQVAYVELLTRARAEVAEARSGTPFRAGHLAGHLEEIGLEPPADAVPEHLLAEGLALVEHLTGNITTDASETAGAGALS